MLSADQALSSVLERVPVLGTVTLSVRRAAGHHLAGDIVAAGNVPPFDNSGMDGFAIRSADARLAGVVLPVDGEAAAGDAPGRPLSGGSARSIMTGAVLPAGADAVVQVEWTERLSGGEVRILKPVPAGANIRTAGSDIRRGDVPLRKGRLLRAFEQGMLASLGIEFVSVHRRPSVLFIPTGNELTGPGEDPGPGKIRDSVSPVVTGLLRREGCDVRGAAITPDDRAGVSTAVAAGASCDMIVTSGGVSAGRRDIVPEALADSGFTTVFHRVNIRPGMPLFFGMRGDVPVFSLPGNPVSAAVTFLQFVRPAIRKMAGDPDPGRKATARARLAGAYSKNDGKRHYVRGWLEEVRGEPTVRVAGAQGSNIASVLAAANCLIIFPEDRTEFADSEIVETEML